MPGAMFHCAGLESLTLTFESVCAMGQLQTVFFREWHVIGTVEKQKS